MPIFRFVPPIPAVCDNCGALFVSTNLIGGVGRVQFTNSRVGPCPNCGGMGSIPDGLYEFAGDAVNIFSTWPIARLQTLAAALQAAQAAPDPMAAVTKILGEDPETQELASYLRSMNPATVIAFITMLLTAIMLFTSQPGTTINANTVIEQVTSPRPPGAIAPAPSAASAPTLTPKTTRKKPPPQSPRKLDKAKAKAKKKGRR